jgi:hypothetical protein
MGPKLELTKILPYLIVDSEVKLTPLTPTYADESFPNYLKMAQTNRKRESRVPVRGREGVGAEFRCIGNPMPELIDFKPTS